MTNKDKNNTEPSLASQFIQGCIKSGMHETTCEKCGTYLLTHNLENLCPQCRGDTTIGLELVTVTPIPQNNTMLTKCQCGQDITVTEVLCNNCREKPHKTDTIPSERSDYFLFLDYETTGELDHKLLEVAWMLTNVDLEPLFECRSEVIHQDSYSISDYVLKMHTKNGLLVEVASSTKDVRQIEYLICDSYQKHIEPNARVTLAGFTCHFDRGLMKRDMPRLDQLLHYRHFDVSVPRGMYSNWVEKIPSRKDEHPHRAKDDVIASWKIAKTYKVLFETLLPRLKDLEGMDL